MTGQYKYNLVTNTCTSLFTIAAFGVWAFKNYKGIIAQISDTQPDEFVGLITLAATQELPKVWAAFQAPAEAPLA